MAVWCEHEIFNVLSGAQPDASDSKRSLLRTYRATRTCKGHFRRSALKHNNHPKFMIQRFPGRAFFIFCFFPHSSFSERYDESVLGAPSWSVEVKGHRRKCGNKSFLIQILSLSLCIPLVLDKCLSCQPK